MFYLSPFTYFTESSWEVAAPPVFSLDFVSQIVLNALGIPQLAMASVDGFPKASPSLTHSAVLVTPSTLWWCTSRQDPYLPLKFLTLDHTDKKHCRHIPVDTSSP